ncbi:probable glutaryl-CoA dehydrogenase, mitochondrial [Octopus sinensis]|uniref:Probable glutaryl-CoA dehydrogenase, mitochondrial n=1 Tax=Octopus sinensis TaxID=2607531 RepID=A0A7E6EHJ6_9MOLL|nr:probable glutaryl-CoA dehydrogenase, mitochondrial [Octopus sinensis]
MILEISLGLLLCHRVAQIVDSTDWFVLNIYFSYPSTLISMAKRNSANKSLQICRTARDMLGANGIVDEFGVIRHVLNLESVNTYEGHVTIKYFRDL